MLRTVVIASVAAAALLHSSQAGIAGVQPGDIDILVDVDEPHAQPTDEYVA